MTTLTALRAETDARRSLLASLLRFAVTGVCSVAIDVGTLGLLHSGLGVRLPWSTLAAYAAGLLVNYSLNRTWTFTASADHRQTLMRYTAMVVFNVSSTLLIVLGLTHLGSFYLVSKLVAVAVNAAVNFLALRYWVFSS